MNKLYVFLICLFIASSVACGIGSRADEEVLENSRDEEAAQPQQKPAALQPFVMYYPTHPTETDGTVVVHNPTDSWQYFEFGTDPKRAIPYHPESGVNYDMEIDVWQQRLYLPPGVSVVLGDTDIGFYTTYSRPLPEDRFTFRLPYRVLEVGQGSNLALWEPANNTTDIDPKFRGVESFPITYPPFRKTTSLPHTIEQDITVELVAADSRLIAINLTRPSGSFGNKASTIQGRVIAGITDKSGRYHYLDEVVDRQGCFNNEYVHGEVVFRLNDAITNVVCHFDMPPGIDFDTYTIWAVFEAGSSAGVRVLGGVFLSQVPLEN